VFHPKSTCSTLAVWSAEKPIATQTIKKIFKRLPIINKTLSSTVRSLGLSELFGFNSTKGNYFHPENGKIVETKNYSKPHDGTVTEIVPCLFKFFEQVSFKDEKYFNYIKDYMPEDNKYLCDQLIQGSIIRDIGIQGDVKRRFFKNQIIDAVKNSS